MCVRESLEPPKKREDRAESNTHNIITVEHNICNIFFCSITSTLSLFPKMPEPRDIYIDVDDTKNDRQGYFRFKLHTVCTCNLVYFYVHKSFTSYVNGWRFFLLLFIRNGLKSNLFHVLNE